jgi:porin
MPVVMALLGGASIPALAQEQPAPAEGQPAPEKPAGLLPIPDYTGELGTRRFLLGDLGGSRTDLANAGVQFDINWNQYVQSVASGGRDNATRYAGTLDYNASFDLMRLGVIDYGFVKMRAETLYGDSVNAPAGAILPVNTDLFFPLTDDIDGHVPFSITSLYWTQMLAPKFGFVIGKLDTLDGDANEFASGRGTSQFLNANFLFNAATALRLPYSTLGGGVFWMPCSRFSLTSTVINTADSSTTTGFEDFGDGTTWTTEAKGQYTLGELPGGVNVGFLYSFDQEFAKLDDRFVFQPGEGLVIPTTDDTWAVYLSGWQYLCVQDAGPGGRPINPGDGVPDHKGLGLYWRAGFADEDTNPVEWSLSGGLGGRGIIPSRDLDVFGVGYYYTKLQPELVSGIPGIRDHAQGVEAFYNVAITPATHLTLDVQAVQSTTDTTETAIVLGMRLGLQF